MVRCRPILITWPAADILLCFFFFNDTAPTDIYTSLHTLSLHDALPISSESVVKPATSANITVNSRFSPPRRSEEHTSELQSRNDISYAVFCLKKKKKKKTKPQLILQNLKKKKK